MKLCKATAVARRVGMTTYCKERERKKKIHKETELKNPSSCLASLSLCPGQDEVKKVPQPSVADTATVQPTGGSSNWGPLVPFLAFQCSRWQVWREVLLSAALNK